MIVKLPEEKLTAPTVGPVEEEKDAPPPLTNDKPHSFELQHEKPWHRLAIMLAAQGYSYTEIAQRTGFTTVAVSIALRQPWARKILLEEIHRAGRDELRAILKAAATDSVFKLISLRDSAENEAVQCSAAKELIDRYLGKAVQPIAELTKPGQSLDIDNIDKEIAELDEKTNQLIGRKAQPCQVSHST